MQAQDIDALKGLTGSCPLNDVRLSRQVAARASLFTAGLQT